MPIVRRRGRVTRWGGGEGSRKTQQNHSAATPTYKARACALTSSHVRIVIILFPPPPSASLLRGWVVAAVQIFAYLGPIDSFLVPV